jgi:hypothetical protein
LRRQLCRRAGSHHDPERALGSIPAKGRGRAGRTFLEVRVKISAILVCELLVGIGRQESGRARADAFTRKCTLDGGPPPVAGWKYELMTCSDTPGGAPQRFAPIAAVMGRVLQCLGGEPPGQRTARELDEKGLGRVPPPFGELFGLWSGHVLVRLSQRGGGEPAAAGFVYWRDLLRRRAFGYRRRVLRLGRA